MGKYTPKELITMAATFHKLMKEGDPRCEELLKRLSEATGRSRDQCLAGIKMLAMLGFTF